MERPTDLWTERVRQRVKFLQQVTPFYRKQFQLVLQEQYFKSWNTLSKNDPNNFSGCCKYKTCIGYRGYQSETKTGKKCIAWDEIHADDEYFHDRRRRPWHIT